MKKSALFLFILIQFQINGQETKLITNKENHETYYVLKSDKSKRHGVYKKTNYNNLIKTIGYYKYGVKDSIWEFFNYKGELEQIFDFSKHELVYYKISDVNKNKKFKLIGLDSSEVILDRPPLYIGGDGTRFEYVAKNIKYTAIAKENGIQGTVQIAFAIDKAGKTSNHKIISGIGYGCDEEALKAVKLIPDDWLPGQLNGHAVDVEYILPIKFKLEG